MELTKLKIKNYKKLNIEKMDLSPNKNNFKNNGNYFEGNKIIPKIIGIAGTNASGKTSIIEVLRLIKLFHTQELFMLLAPAVIQDKAIKQYFENVLNSSEETQISGFGNDNDFKYLSNYSSIISDTKKLTDFTSKKEIQNVLTNAVNDFYISIFENSARIKDKDIEIEFEIEDDLKLYNFKMIINAGGVQLLSKNSGSDNNGMKVFYKLQKSIIISAATLRELSPIKIGNHFNVHMNPDIHLNINQKSIINKYKEDKRIWSLLKMADPSIGSIYFDNELKETRVKLTNGNDISINFISFGSRKLIELFTDILKAEKVGGILICDELENSLNQSIISAIKTFIKNTNIQLIFTSHSGSTLANGMDNKQIFILEPVFNKAEEQIVSDIWKFSSKFNKNNKFESIYNKSIVASPSINSVSNFLEVILNENGD